MAFYVFYLYNKGTGPVDQKKVIDIFFTRKFYGSVTYNTHQQTGKITP